jgi:hypothetical protein
MPGPDVADATQDDALTDQLDNLPTAFADDQPADHATDPAFVPPAQYDEGLEAAP